MFPSQGLASLSDLPGPYYRYRPYLWFRGVLLSPGTANAGSGLISGSEFASAAETPTNVLLDNLATETGTGADAAVTIALSAADSASATDSATNVGLVAATGETGTSADAAATVNVLPAGETGNGADAATNVLLDNLAAETGTAADGAGVQIFPVGTGFFASQGLVNLSDLPGPYFRGQPYLWHRSGALLSAAQPTGGPVPISSSDSASASDAVAGVLLAGPSDATAGSDLALTIFVSASGDVGSSSDLSVTIALASLEAASGSEGSGIGVGGSDAALATDAFGSITQTSGPGIPGLRWRLTSPLDVTVASSPAGVSKVTTEVEGT